MDDHHLGAVRCACAAASSRGFRVKKEGKSGERVAARCGPDGGRWRWSRWAMGSWGRRASRIGAAWAGVGRCRRRRSSWRRCRWWRLCGACRWRAATSCRRAWCRRWACRRSRWPSCWTCLGASAGPRPRSASPSARRSSRRVETRSSARGRSRRRAASSCASRPRRRPPRRRRRSGGPRPRRRSARRTRSRATASTRRSRRAGAASRSGACGGSWPCPPARAASASRRWRPTSRSRSRRAA